MSDDVTLNVCMSCIGAPVAAVKLLQGALARADLPVRPIASGCLGPCEAPLVVALQGERRATCVFAGLELPGDIDDVVATCRTYLDSPGGWIEDARPCGRLRFRLRTRVPAAE